MRVIFLCPSDDRPTGGVKVIYRHCELLNTLGLDCVVMHPFDLDFRCSWFSHEARFATGPQLDPRRDFVIVPDLWALPFGAQCRSVGVRYGIFVQNGYLTHPILPSHTRADMEEVYQDAALILSISADSTRMVRCNYPGIKPEQIVDIRYSIGENFRPPPSRYCGAPPKRITFMPRKLADHAVRVVFALSGQLPPGWCMVAIQNASETDVAKSLFDSSLFLSFSEFEGLPLPPLEAAIAGNLVVGYTGQGAREYWQAPHFHEIQQGDIIGFVEAVAIAAQAFERGMINRAALEASSDALAARFSLAAEMAGLAALALRIAALFSAAPRAASHNAAFV
jgi:hypothetical protein